MEGNLEQMQNITGKIKELEIDKTLSKKGKCAESKAVGEALATKVSITDIVDDLTSVADDKPLSANQGRVLKKQIDDVDPHYAENVGYGDTTVKDALDELKTLSVKSYVTETKNISIEGTNKLDVTFTLPSGVNEVLSVTPISTNSSVISTTISSVSNTQIAVIYRNHGSGGATPQVKLRVMYR